MLGNQRPGDPADPNYFTTSGRNPTRNWRIRINQTQLVSQASTVLLQRHSKLWAPLLKPLKFSSNFTPSLFHQILNRIETHPKICFSFFNWAQKTLDFKPDIGDRCRIIRILLGSELSVLGNPILDSIVQDYPPAKIFPLLIQSRKAVDFQNISPVMNSVVECYCSKQMYLQSLEVYHMAKDYRIGLSVDSCNTLLNLLGDKNELKLAWCYYASIIRNGVSGNRFTWSSIARILHKDGKFERISKVFDVGIFTPEMFDLIIDGHSKRGDFEAAFDYLNRMCSKEIGPSFSTYSSILNGACKHQDGEIIENMLSLMVEKGHIAETPVCDYDSIVKELCDEGKTFAVDLFSERAYEAKIELQHGTYECMLMALLSEEARLEDAIKLYKIVREKNILLSESCYSEFVVILCKENPSREITNLLVDITKQGFFFQPKELSGYISKQCAEGRWREADEIFNAVLNKRFLLDSTCCGSIVKRHCSSGQIGKAIVVHNKLEELKGSLDIAAYNKFIAALFRDNRAEETIKVFDYMKACKIFDGESFSHMISGLCRVKELRKAMRFHDEMLELGLKPDRKTYKRLISGFG
ncbi:hypothetical protein ABFX02_13G121000 [Erythranthe guttata]